MTTAFKGLNEEQTLEVMIEEERKGLMAACVLWENFCEINNTSNSLPLLHVRADSIKNFYITDNPGIIKRV